MRSRPGFAGRWTSRVDQRGHPARKQRAHDTGVVRLVLDHLICPPSPHLARLEGRSPPYHPALLTLNALESTRASPAFSTGSMSIAWPQSAPRRRERCSSPSSWAKCSATFRGVPSVPRCTTTATKLRAKARCHLPSRRTSRDSTRLPLDDVKEAWRHSPDGRSESDAAESLSERQRHPHPLAHVTTGS